MADVSITGLDTLLRRLSALQKNGADRVMRTAIKAGLGAIGAQMKKDLSPQVKEAKTAVGSRFKRGKQIVAKVGFGVGKRKKQKPLKARTQRGGVGISATNVHWWIAGTKQRATGRKRSGKPSGNAIRNRGRMPSMQSGLATRAEMRSRAKQQSAMIRAATRALEREIKKLQSVG